MHKRDVPPQQPSSPAAAPGWVQGLRGTFTSLPFYPILFGTYYIFFLYARNIEELSIGNVVRPLAILLSTTSVILLAARVIFGNAQRTATVLFLFLVFFATYGHVVPFARATLWGTTWRLLGEWALALFWLYAFLVCAVVATKKIKQVHLPGLTTALNFTSMVLLLFPLLTIANSAAFSDTDEGKTETYVNVSGSSSGPDVYYVIPDAYARADVLFELYDYDNSPFIDQLQERGFYVASRSNANYNWTPFSLASSLNMSYLDAYNLHSINRGYDKARGSAVHGHFNGIGHQYIGLGQEFKTVSNLDLSVDVPSVNSLEAYLLRVTPINLLLRATSLRTSADRRRYEIRSALQYIGDIALDPTPKFVLCHIRCPHQSFVFDAAGNDVDNTESLFLDVMALQEVGGDDLVQQYRHFYAGQLAHVSTLIIQAIDAILVNSASPPIIILQSDHGPHGESDHHHLANMNLWERYGILNAYYFPDQDYDNLYPEITPVNSFRVVLNQYFDGDYPLEEDRSFFLPWKSPDVVEVTEDIPR